MKKVLTVLVLAAMTAGVVFAGGGQQSGAASGGAAASAGGIKIAMMPKFKGENYFDAVRVGAQEAVDELNKSGGNITFLYDGPPQDQATNQQQVNILEGWIAQGVNVILLSPNDPTAIAPTLKRAQGRGIKVLTFDADAQADARDLFVNQADFAAIASGLIGGMAQGLEAKGYGASKPANIAMISSAKTDANQQSWLKACKELIAAKYSWLVIQNEDTDVYYPGPDETTTAQAAGTLIGRMGPGANQIQGAIGLTSMATPQLGSNYASAAQKPDVTKVSLTGLATPNAIKTYIKDSSNAMDSGVLWNCMDLGYLAIQCGYQMGKGTLSNTASSVTAGRLGSRDIVDKMVVLGPALIFDAKNEDQYTY
jgi:ABC-type sugar transport system substrate-binding protein